jgi:hypothetical protein
MTLPNSQNVSEERKENQVNSPNDSSENLFEHAFKKSFIFNAQPD